MIRGCAKVLSSNCILYTTDAADKKENENQVERLLVDKETKREVHE